MKLSASHASNWAEELFLKGWRPYALIVMVGFALYAKTLFFNYTYLDDRELILLNYKFLSNISNVVQAFKQTVYFNSPVPYYRPLLLVSFILDAQAGGLNPFIYHFTNVLIHLGCASLVFFLLLKMGYERRPSVFFSLFFVTHPMLAQAVGWIPGRNDSMACLFALLAFIFLIDFLKSGRTGQYILHIAFLAAGIFAKESDIILIALFGLYTVSIRKERWLASKAVMLWGGYLFVTGLWLFLRHMALYHAVQINIFEAVRFFLIQLPAQIQLIGKAVFPFNLSVLPVMGSTTIVYGILAITLVATSLFFSKSKRPNFVFFGLAWVLLFLIPPVLRPHAVIVGDVLEHRFYLPMIGFIIVLLEIDYIKDAFRKPAGVTIGTLVILLFIALGAERLENFRNKITFWEDAAKNAPDSVFIRLLLGTMYYNDERWDDAEREINRSMRTDPLNGGHYYIGSIYLRRGLLKEAEKEFRKHIALYPRNGPSYLALGVLYYNRGQLKEAEGLWKRALELNPDDAVAMKNLAIYYLSQEDPEKARYYAGELKKRGVAVPQEFMKALSTDE